MDITDELLDYVAKLAKIKIAVSERDSQKKAMQSIVTYMDILKTIDTSNVEASSHIYPIKNIFREDVITPSYDRESILENAPEKKDGCFKVPKTVE